MTLFGPMPSSGAGGGTGRGSSWYSFHIVWQKENEIRQLFGPTPSSGAGGGTGRGSSWYSFHIVWQKDNEIRQLFGPTPSSGVGGGTGRGQAGILSTLSGRRTMRSDNFKSHQMI